MTPTDLQKTGCVKKYIKKDNSLIVVLSVPATPYSIVAIGTYVFVGTALPSVSRSAAAPAAARSPPAERARG